MTAPSMTLLELAMFVGRLEERLSQAERRQAGLRKRLDDLPRRAHELTAQVDERIESALAVANSRSLSEYIDGRCDGSDSTPQVLDVEAGTVQAGPAVANGLLRPDLGDPVAQFTHDLAPSVGPEGSVGGSPAQGSASSAGDDASNGQR